MAENIAASNGMEITPAQKRGATTRAIGIDRHHLHGGQLLGRLHQADLGGDRRAGAAGKQQRRHHRTQFAHQRQRHQNAQRLGRNRSAGSVS